MFPHLFSLTPILSDLRLDADFHEIVQKAPSTRTTAYFYEYTI